MVQLAYCHDDAIMTPLKHLCYYCHHQEVTNENLFTNEQITQMRTNTTRNRKRVTELQQNIGVFTYK